MQISFRCCDPEPSVIRCIMRRTFYKYPPSVIFAYSASSLKEIFVFSNLLKLDYNSPALPRRVPDILEVLCVVAIQKGYFKSNIAYYLTPYNVTYGLLNFCQRSMRVNAYVFHFPFTPETNFKPRVIVVIF